MRKSTARHRVALAGERSQSLSRTLAELIGEALDGAAHADIAIEIDHRTGLPLVRVGRPITSDDVRC